MIACRARFHILQGPRYLSLMIGEVACFAWQWLIRKIEQINAKTVEKVANNHKLVSGYMSNPEWVTRWKIQRNTTTYCQIFSW